ncbi:Helix-turn-helix, Fis-type:molybdenum-binding protein [Pseudomonas amygdali pv. mori]|uniref:Helix-turn-helix, Fis-type:molybdenum-binding protein n=2 Tax=Pseudomonas amygdali pv. mori TaxID=34065 RepID=A0A3M5J2M0_PSEA0|nr:Helix-turn-helix, Fis-type:molybdenum-binding protein [Pseudomonas amygdali pv. mori]
MGTMLRNLKTLIAPTLRVRFSTSCARAIILPSPTRPPRITMSLPTPLTQHIVHRPQRIALLQHIAEQGSITSAAKSAGLSYKAAWDAIDELNNLAQKPLVERSVGGRGGGGAKLSLEGERVLRLYQRVQALQAQVLEAAEDSSDLDLLNRLTLRTSARNQLLGRIVSITRQGHNDQVRLQLAGEVFIEAQVTHDSTLRLELENGTEVVALIKAGWLELHADNSEETNGNNCLIGRIDNVTDAEDGPSEVRITLPGGQTLCALATPEHLHARQLKSGATVQARFAASLVLLGIPM